jgi:glycine dehydrogenase subunit 1
MPFIPHTAEDVQTMLATIGATSLEALFAEIPPDLRAVDLSALPAGQSEMELSRLMQQRAQQLHPFACFIGAGAYEHYIPGAVWDLATRGEFMTAYTPYQAEASQGSLQLMYEYQTMMASLMGLEVSNASLYEGASALAEAILMALRLLAAKSAEIPTILMPQTVHPHYREVVQTILGQHEARLVAVPYDKKSGRITVAALEAAAPTAHILIIPQPNFLGILEEADTLTLWAKQKNMLVIGVVNPLAMALLKPPGQWAAVGADLACGEGQPLGIPLSCGGPYYGFLCAKRAYLRQMPGRIVGRTVDRDGKEGFVLTLQAREQHIRRAKATSNICTNQGLMVTASTLYLSLMGPQGLRKIATAAQQRAKTLSTLLTALPGVELLFSAPFYNEFALRLPRPVDNVLRHLAQQHIQGGYNLKPSYPELGGALLVCATETKTIADLENYAQILKNILSNPLLIGS